MFWLERPPYLRWAAAVVLVALAASAELRRAPTVQHPFLRDQAPAGTELTEALVEWRAVPPGLLPAVEVAGAAGRLLQAGEPLLPSSLATGVEAPEGWWALSVALPSGTLPGAAVQLVLLPNDPTQSVRVVPGVVMEAGAGGDAFAVDAQLGTVAVPPEAAAAAAVAAAEGRLTVLVEP